MTLILLSSCNLYILVLNEILPHNRRANINDKFDSICQGI